MADRPLTLEAIAADCPPCPRCGRHTAMPAQYAGRGLTSRDPRDLWCPACDKVWRETDHAARGQAWTAWCAWLDRQDHDAAAERAQERRDEARLAELNAGRVKR